MDKTIRELQSSLPWTVHYHRDFRASPMTHKDFAHALLHVHKAGGKLAAIINDAEHGGFDWEDPAKRQKIGDYIADFVVCALRMANTCPDGILDLQKLVEERIHKKNNQEISRRPHSEIRAAKDMPKGCSSGHKPMILTAMVLNPIMVCKRCGIFVDAMTALHVHDPRSDRKYNPQ